MKRKFRTLIFLLLTTLGTLMVTGCGSSLTIYFTSDLPQAISERGQLNKDIAESLKNAGFIDKKMYSNLCSQIDKQVDDIVKGSDLTNKKVAENSAERFAAAASAIKAQKPDIIEYEKDDDSGTHRDFWTGSNVFKKTGSPKGTASNLALSYYVASNYVASNYYGANGGLGSKGFKYNKWKKIDDSKVEPINFFAGQDNLVDTLNERFRADMYVLDADAIKGSGKSLDEVFAAIKKAVDDDDISGVTNYFKKLTDSNGNAVCLMDPKNFKLIKDSGYNDNASVNVPGKDLIMKQSLLYKPCRKVRETECNCGCGGCDACKDLDKAKKVDMEVLKLRFTEFDKEAYDELCKTIDMNSGAYYFSSLAKTTSKGGTTTKCYVLTYPITTIKSFKLDNKTGDVTAEFRDDSGMAVSLKSGKLVSYDYKSNGSGFEKANHEVTTSDPYLTMSFDSGVGDEKCSLVCDGYRKDTIDVLRKDDKDKSKNKTVSIDIVVPRIILRDYLEATWAPGSLPSDVSTTETLVVFGRKIRFRTDSNFWTPAKVLKFNGKKYERNTLKYNIKNKNYCAYFVNVDGEEVKTATRLNITDFCDIKKLTDASSGTTNTTTYVSGTDPDGWTDKVAVANTVAYLDTVKSIGIPPAGCSNQLKTMFGDTFVKSLSFNQPLASQSKFDDLYNDLVDKQTELGASSADVKQTSNKWAKYTVAHFREGGIDAASKECRAEDIDLTPTQDKLASTTDVDSIALSYAFPSKQIGAIDMTNTGAEVQRFYCVATTKGMFDSALYSSWINSTASKESLTWWNKYLSEHGYKYKIGADELEDYVQTNYKYELSQEGAIILDLDTIHTIQEIYDDEDSLNRASMIKTIFVIIGIFLIAYSMILMLCWVIDTNVDLGFSLTNKLTFGHWIAIQYEEELPTYNNEEHKYIDGKHMLIKCLIIIAVAIVCIRVDISEVVLVLIRTFGKIASYVEKMIRGLI